MTDHLFRSLAPITDEVWRAVDDEAARTLRHFLVARRLVDFSGPVGYETAALATGHAEPLSSPLAPGVDTSQRTSVPLLELHADLHLPRSEADAVARGAADPDLQTVTDAARRLAIAEDTLVFDGYEAAGIPGMVSSCPHDPVSLGDDYSAYPDLVARAVATLQDAAVGGPYAVALGPRAYTAVVETTENGGYPLLKHLRLIADGGVFWVPAVNGAIVLSVRGGDFELTVGEDVAVGYRSHDREHVELRIEETVAFRVHTPEAAVALRHG